MEESVIGRIGRLVSRLPAGLLAAATLVVGASWLAPAPASGALTNFTWSGGGSIGWTDGGNWTGGAAPIPDESIGTLTFPQLASCGLTSCLVSNNNISGLSANAVSVVDTAGYEISGEPLALGSEGITAFPGSPVSVQAPDVSWGIPLTLTADQDWSITGAGTGDYQGNLALDDAVTGSSTLDVQLADQAYLSDRGGMEVGAFTATGADSADTGLDADMNGTIWPTSLNSATAEPVSVTDVVLADEPNRTLQPHVDEIGPLTATGANLTIGDGNVPDAILSVNGGVTLGSGNVTVLLIDQGGSTAGTDYSQLRASGNITLGGDLLVDKGEGCAALGTGATATLITTSGTLSGTFANAPNGSVVSIPSCPGQALAARILYTSNSVTATVVSGGTTATTLSADPTTATTNQPVSLTATVTTGTPLYAGPMGAIEFLEGTTPIAGCTAQPLTASNATTGTATCTASFAAAASPAALTALYTPSSGSELTGSTSPPLSLSVSPAATSVTVAASSSTLTVGQSVIYTAYVASPDTGAVVPTGTVSFADGGVTIASCESQPMSASGVATCTVTPASGSHAVSASYGGDANFSGSASSAVDVTVSTAPATGTPTVGQPKTSGTTLSVPVSCTGGTSCTITLTLTITETLKGANVIAVSAAKHKIKRKLVTVGRVTVTIAAGHAKTVKMSLNATGRKLLTKEHTLPLKLTVAQGKLTVTTKTLTVKAETGRTHTRVHG